MTRLIDIYEGWTQVPPGLDGRYWFAHAAPWDTYIQVDPVALYKGRRVACEDVCDVGLPVWNPADDSELLAAWRPNPGGPPPEPPPHLYERHAYVCPVCSGLAGVYRTPAGNPWVCYACLKTGRAPDQYFTEKFARALGIALMVDTPASGA